MKNLKELEKKYAELGREIEALKEEFNNINKPCIGKKVVIDMKTYKVTVDKVGNTRWYNKNNEIHREDGPAIEWADGTKSYYINGKRHREDGPAVEWADGTKLWYLNDKCHREDGPAVEWADGTKLWYLNDKCHREDGPAVEWSNGGKYWFINGKKLTEEEFNNINKPCIGKKVVIDGIEYTLK